MIKTEELVKSLSEGDYNEKLAYLYSCHDNVQSYADRFINVINGYKDIFGEADELSLFSAPGRTILTISMDVSLLEV